MGTRLQGRVAVIIGACSGVGLATAKKFLDEGAKVVLGDVNAEAGAAIAEELGATFVGVDVTDADSVEALFKTAFDAFGSVDIAFNNAELTSLEDESILTTGLDTWRDVHEANLTSVYLCCKAALRYMLEHKHGSIINTASVAAVMGAATSQIAYTAAQGGVLSLSRELGVQFARDGIRVNALCHGPVSTPLSQELFDSDPDSAERRFERIPMGRFAEPQEIASAVLFLASDESSFITASQFMVDGGLSAASVAPI
jgi:NAD(P)-dependent dehydrogenase (short-subunit alcohol dehydrogenase family)